MACMQNASMQRRVPYLHLCLGTRSSRSFTMAVNIIIFFKGGSNIHSFLFTVCLPTLLICLRWLQNVELTCCCRPRLGPTLPKVIGVGVLYFVISAIDGYKRATTVTFLQAFKYFLHIHIYNSALCDNRFHVEQNYQNCLVPHNKDNHLLF